MLYSFHVSSAGLCGTQNTTQDHSQSDLTHVSLVPLSGWKDNLHHDTSVSRLLLQRCWCYTTVLLLL